MKNNKYTLLIIDDSAHNIELISGLFINSYNIVTARSGKEALKIMRTKAASIDVVLLDIMMPEMNGYEVLRAMGDDDALKFIPVIVITSDDDEEAEHKSFELGAADFITRPFNFTTVEKRVKSVLHQRELEALHEENERLKREAESEMHLSALMDNLPGGVAIIETDGITAECTYFNNAVPDLFHMNGEEFMNEFRKDKIGDWLKTFIERAKNGGKLNYAFSVKTNKSSRRFQKTKINEQWIRMSASGIGRNNGKWVMYCVFLDINAEKQQEQRAYDANKRLQENEMRIDNMINNAPGGLALCEENENGALKVLYCSRGLADIMGCPDYDRYLFELLDSPDGRVIDQDDVINFKRSLGVASVTGKAMEHIFKCRSYGGDPIWIKMRGQLTRDDKGKMSLYCFVNDITKEREYEQELRTNAYYDSLTGLYNRKAFYANAGKILEYKPDIDYSVMRLNIGSFKLINDIMGRETGDRVLITIAEIIKSILPENGVYARFFSDNFMIMVPCDEIEPEIIIGTVKREIEERNIVSHDVQYYIGVYKVTDRDLPIEDICDRAVIACRSITGSFKQHIAYYDENMRKEMLEEQEICDEAPKALANNEFCIYYQPVYGIKAKRFVSAEALVRWKHPIKGLISPGKFIPVFEKNGFIAELDLYVLEQVCRYQKKRREMGLEPFPISVNISRMSLYNPRLFDIITELTEKYDVEPSCFRIEVTETAYNDNPAQLLETIRKLREKCYPVLMDDFGSGYSSLNTLKDIPIDVLKLDMKFMQDFEKNSRVGTIVTSVARMSKWLNVPMLAEGVETKEQYDFLESIGCAYIQGYLFSKPICEEEFTDLIAERGIVLPARSIESYGIDGDVNELLGNNGLISKLISGVFGGLGIYELSDDKLEVIRVNEGYMQIMGYTPDDFTGEHYNIWEKLHPDDVEKSKEACLEAQRTDRAVRATVRRYDRNGKLLYLEGIHRRLGGSEENPIFCIAFNDISELLENDRIIRQSKDQITSILDATGAFAIDMDLVNGDIFCAGDSKEYGFTVNELARLIRSDEGLISITHPDERKKMLKFHMKQSSKRFSQEFRLKSKNGDYRWCRFTKSCGFDENGNVVKVMGIINDIDAEKQAAIALEKTKIQMDVAMQNLNAGIIILEVDEESFESKIVYSNAGFWKLIGKRPDDGYNFTESVINSIGPAEAKKLKDKVRKGEGNHFSYRIHRDDGKDMWLELTSAPTEFKENRRSNHMIILTDVTERYINANKLEAIVSNFYGGLALISRTGNEITLSYANNKFYKVLGLENGKDQELASVLKHILEYRYGSVDMNVAVKGGKARIVKTHAVEFDNGIQGEESYVVTAEDVTLRRAEAKNRIAERRANAATGLYNEVFKIDFREKTTTMLSSRIYPDKAKNARPIPLEFVLTEWIQKHIHPDDRVKASELFTAPLRNADFTDAYSEIRIADPECEGEYKAFGTVMVRSEGDICMLYNKDLERIDDSHTSAEVAETNRLYKLLAEITNTTVIEYDHSANRFSASPSFKEFAASETSEDGLKSKDNYIKGTSVHPEDREAFSKFIKALQDPEEPKKIILRMKMADGSYKWCRMSVNVVKNSSGAITKSLTTINIIHEEIIARRKAEEMDNLLKKTVKHIPVGIGIYKVENGIPTPLYVSDNIQKIFGIDKNGRTFDLSVTEDFTKNNRIIPGTEGEYVQQCKRPDGSSFWLSTRYRIKDENGTPIIYAALDDITEKVYSQRRQSVQDQMYQMLLEETGTIIFYYDTENDRLTYYHPSAGNNELKTVNGIMDDSSLFTLLEKSDRDKFVKVLSKLSFNAGTDELLVSLHVNGYPRRYQCFFKSISDEDGKVYRIFGKIEDVDDEIARLETIRAKAMYDSLCVDIYNKATTEELIKAELAGGQGAGGALIMIDVDDFKSINDRLGHMFGDEFLKKFATTVKGEFRDSDIVGRYGGDEFFVFINHASAELAEKKCRRILEQVLKIEIPEIGGVKSSIGIAPVTAQNRDYRQLLKQADSALYTAKNRGKNQVVMFDPNTMSEGSYRTEKAVARGRSNVVLSSNPNSSASLIMRISSALYSSIDIHTGIEQMLALTGKSFNVSRVYIFEDSDDGLFCSNTFEWCNNGIEPVIDTLQNVSYESDLGGCYRDNFNDDNIFYCHDINTLCEEQRELLAEQGIKSMLQCAIMEDGLFKGYVGFDECRSNRFWTQDQIDALVFISKVISIFLLKDRSRRKTENYAKSIKSILDDYPQYIYIVDKESHALLYMNNMTCNALGGNKVGELCKNAICQSKDPLICPIREFLNHKGSKPVDMISPVLNKKIKAQATEVDWEGKKAYLVTCMLTD